MNNKTNNNHLPPYLGVYNSLYSDITGGTYPAGEVLPSETALADKYKVSRNTLRQALAILNEDGLIIKSQGKGTMVSNRSQIAADATIANPLTTLSKEKITDTRIIYNYNSPTEIARSKLKLTESDLVLACNTIYTAGDMVTGYSFTQIPAPYFIALNLNTAADDSIREAVTTGVFSHAAQAEMSVKLIFANEIEVEFLPVPLDTPLLLIENILLDKSLQPFARCKSYLRPDCYHLVFHLK